MLTPDPDVPFTLEVSQADATGRRVCVARGPDGEFTDKFDPADAFRREKFLQRAIGVGMLPDGDTTKHSVSVYFQSCLRQADGLLKEDRAEPPPLAPIVRNAASIPVRPVDWLWPGRLPLGSLAILAGDPGLSKSTLALEVAARVTRGDAWPDGRPATIGPGAVLVLSAEDDAATTIVPRLRAHGADLDRVELLDGLGRDGKTVERGVSLSLDLDLIRTVVDTRDDWRLIIVDPISAYTPGVDSHRNSEVRSLLAPLAGLASQRGLGVLCVTHLNKAQGGPAIYRTMGSLAFVAAARVAHLVARDPEDPDRRLLLPIKNNLAPDRDGLAYTIESSAVPGAEGVGRIAWSAEPVRMSADDLGGAPEGSAPSRRDTRTADAEHWLAERLAEGPLPSRELIGDASVDEGIGEKTLRKAARRLGVETVRPGGNSGPYLWRLPGAGAGSAVDAPVVGVVGAPPGGANQETTSGAAAGPPSRDGEAASDPACQHEWRERPSAFDGYVHVACAKCGESLGDQPIAAA